MDHFFHIFIPGTPENTAILGFLPALAPVQYQIQIWWLSWRHGQG